MILTVIATLFGCGALLTAEIAGYRLLTAADKDDDK